MSHLTRENQALFNGPWKHRKISTLETNLPLKLGLFKKNIFTSNHCDEFQLNSLNRNEEKQKITAAIAIGKFAGSAISMLSEESDW